jgi:small GTP-binding protein
MNDTHIVAKVVLCGDYKVGKTSLRRNFMGLSFYDKHIPTLGVDISRKTLTPKDDVKLDLQIWDFGGQPGFESLRQRYLLGISGVVLVFDLTVYQSFQNLSNWMKEIRNDLNNFYAPIVLLGNKADLSDFQVTDDEILKFVASIEKDNVPIDYYITSAKTGLNVEESFTKLGNLISNQVLSKIK